MNKVAIAFSTKDRVELSQQSVQPLLQPTKFDLFWIDGSTSAEAEDFPCNYGTANFKLHDRVRGGACRAIVYALTALLNASVRYEYVGLCENDVLLDPDWFECTMDLFKIGAADGLEVGAVSARCYEDRILCQRKGYALMMNLGAGMVIFTRAAAELVLHTYRTHWTMENRRAYAALSGLDIGTYWAFRASEHFLVADWAYDRLLSTQLGLASLALTPSPCDMIGQDPPLPQQGLTLARADIGARIDDAAFERYVSITEDIRDGLLTVPDNGLRYRDDVGATIIFPHQVGSLEQAAYEGNWRLKWSQGFGPFAWQAGSKGDSLTLTLCGPAEFLVSGGSEGGGVILEDLKSGYKASPHLPKQEANQAFLQLPTPTSIAYRQVRLTATDPGVILYGIRTREPQPLCLDWRFDDTVLPPVQA